jgi:hypothetical protein
MEPPPGPEYDASTGGAAADEGASSEHNPPHAAKNMTVFPLIYGFRELVAGAGFVAGVTVEGRALVKREGDSAWWVYGVEPGGVAAQGGNEHEAYMNFRDCLREILADSAALHHTFDAFRADIEMLGHQVNAAWDAEWQAARAALRTGDLKPAGPLADLPRKTGDVIVGISALELRRPTAEDNAVETKFEAAA